MTVESESGLEGQIAEWRAYMQRRPELRTRDADELEDHLRDRIGELTASGLQSDEAFLIAVKRMGSLDALSREFAREHSDRLWKQLVLPGDPGPAATARSRRELPVMVACAAVAAISVKVPALFGVNFLADDGEFYLRNLSFFVLPALAAYFLWQRRVSWRVVGVLAASFVLGAVAANAFPWAKESHTEALTAIHLPMALWLVVGVAYAGGEWRSSRRRMDFIRFTGEWAIYYVLIALGGGVLTGFTAGTFQAIGIEPDEFVGSWLVPCGAAAAVIVAAWLVEAKKSVVENMAPVLTRVFTPLFAATLLAFLVAVVWTMHIDVDRDVLILFDLLLVVVLGLLLYALSARDPDARPGLFDRLQLGLVVSALLLDALVLIALTGRITEFGFSANKTAALGENLILLANLAWSAWLFFRFLRGRTRFSGLERWQTHYVLVYAVWAWAVVLTFPLIFGYA